MATTMIDATTVKSWLDRGEAVLVDVREPAEFAAEHIAGAHSVPLSRLSWEALPEHAGKKLVMQCLRGARGGNACASLLKHQGDAEMYNLDGGLDAWKAVGLPTVKGTQRVLPLDRQVQLTIGIVLLTGFLLGQMVSASFFWLMAFFGAGLTFAGATGFCGLAMLLARMPWNKCGA
jgi:rhodanese-related sulfurtransferase